MVRIPSVEEHRRQHVVTKAIGELLAETIIEAIDSAGYKDSEYKTTIAVNACHVAMFKILYDSGAPPNAILEVISDMHQSMKTHLNATISKTLAEREKEELPFEHIDEDGDGEVE